MKSLAIIFISAFALLLLLDSAYSTNTQDCGDDVLNFPELCDGTPGCTDNCLTTVPVCKFQQGGCGDGVVQAGEQCDLGCPWNGRPSHCCTASCKWKSNYLTIPCCGNNVTNRGEQCDLGGQGADYGKATASPKCNLQCKLINCDTTVPTVPGPNGCTPGFWKSHQNFPASYPYSDASKPLQSLVPAFTACNAAWGSVSLYGALFLGGGDCYALARHLAASIFNSGVGQTPGYTSFSGCFASIDDIKAVLARTLTVEQFHQIFADCNERTCTLNVVWKTPRLG